MRPPYSTLTPTHIYDYAATLLEPYLQWHDYGPKCTVKTLLQVLFYAAGHLCSVFAACSQLRTAPSDQAVRDALTALCPDPAPLEQRLNRLFAAQIPKGLRKRTQRVAIDLTLVPYHGQPHQRLEEIYRSQAKSGTTHFHAYATAYIVRRGQRFTVALIRVEYGTPMVEVLKRLLHLLRQAGIRPRLLLLDRGSQVWRLSAICTGHATPLSCRWFATGAPPMTLGVPAARMSLPPPRAVAGIPIP
jgi:hypothetical protein